MISTQTSTAYHVSPGFARSSIKKHGLNPRKSEYFSGSDRVYLFTNLESAKWYRNTYSRMGGEYTPMDIWAVNISNLDLKKDWGLSSDEETNEQGDAVYHEGPISKTRVKLFSAGS